MICRHCHNPLNHVFLDLGFAPPSNAYLTYEDLSRPERYYPLRLLVCDRCWLVQTEDYAQADELFSKDYAYFSSVSTSWLNHAAAYCQLMTKELALGTDSFVVEIAANDGYLLRNFVASGIPCLGIEPTDSTAAAAEKLGVPVLREFFGLELALRLAERGQRADLIVGNNVYAHVPDINDFTRGMQVLLKEGGTITLEFPHLMRLLEFTQFDTIYHEHYSYLSLTTVRKIFSEADLRIWNVEELPTHGGSLRVYGCHENDSKATLPHVEELLREEASRGMCDISTYVTFQKRADAIKNELLAFLLNLNKTGRQVAAYGAAAKGCTLLNYAGIKPDLLPYVCDAAPSKQGKYLPGSHIPILHPDEMRARRPDLILILPWNIRSEIREQLAFTREWGAKLAVAVPAIEVL